MGSGGDSGEAELAAESAKDIGDLTDRANRCLEAGADIVMIESEGITENANQLGELVDASPEVELVRETGIGPFTAATALVAWSHPGRVRNEAAFASLGGVNPSQLCQATQVAIDSTVVATEASIVP